MRAPEKSGGGYNELESLIEGKLLDFLRRGDKNVLPKGQFSGDLKNCLVLDPNGAMNDDLKRAVNKEWPTIKKHVFDWLEKNVRTASEADAKAVKDEYLEYLDSIVLYPARGSDDIVLAIQANGAKNATYTHGMALSNLFNGYMIYTMVAMKRKGNNYVIDKSRSMKTVRSHR